MESECLFIDGTFKLTLLKFSQVVVIIGKKKNWWFVNTNVICLETEEVRVS